MYYGLYYLVKLPPCEQKAWVWAQTEFSLLKIFLRIELAGFYIPDDFSLQRKRPTFNKDNVLFYRILRCVYRGLEKFLPIETFK